jgi:hypothetical protein
MEAYKKSNYHQHAQYQGIEINQSGLFVKHATHLECEQGYRYAK